MRDHRQSKMASLSLLHPPERLFERFYPLLKRHASTLLFLSPSFRFSSARFGFLAGVLFLGGARFGFLAGAFFIAQRLRQGNVVAERIALLVVADDFAAAHSQPTTTFN